MAHFLYRIEPTRMAMLTEGPTPREAAIVAEHVAYLERLVAADVVLMAGRTLVNDARSFGIVVFAAASDHQAVRIMKCDPAVREGGDAGGALPVPNCDVVRAGSAQWRRNRAPGVRSKRCRCRRAPRGTAHRRLARSRG